MAQIRDRVRNDNWWGGSGEISLENEVPDQPRGAWVVYRMNKAMYTGASECVHVGGCDFAQCTLPVYIALFVS